MTNSSSLSSQVKNKMQNYVSYMKKGLCAKTGATSIMAIFSKFRVLPSCLGKIAKFRLCSDSLDVFLLMF